MSKIIYPDPLAILRHNSNELPMVGSYFATKIKEVIEVTDMTVTVLVDSDDFEVRLFVFDLAAIDIELLKEGNYYVFGYGLVDNTNTHWLVNEKMSTGYLSSIMWMGPKNNIRGV